MSEKKPEKKPENKPRATAGSLCVDGNQHNFLVVAWQHTPILMEAPKSVVDTTAQQPNRIINMQEARRILCPTCGAGAELQPVRVE